jgi:hypothetical protein
MYIIEKVYGEPAAVTAAVVAMVGSGQARSATEESHLI